MSDENHEDNSQGPKIYALENFIDFFAKKHMKIDSCWLVDGRVSFLEVSYIYESAKFFIYVQSKFHFTADGSFVFPKYKLNAIMEDDPFPKDLNSIAIKKYLDSVVDIVKNQPIKMLHLGKKHIIFIRYSNDLDCFELEVPRTTSDFFYVTDWETFYNQYKELPQACGKVDKMLLHMIHELQTVKELGSHTESLIKLAKVLHNWKPKKNFEDHIARINKLDLLISRTNTDQRDKTNIIGVRNNLRNLIQDQMFVLSSLGEVCGQLTVAAEKLN